jgi:hypothetical protein
MSDTSIIASSIAWRGSTGSTAQRARVPALTGLLGADPS